MVLVPSLFDDDEFICRSLSTYLVSHLERNQRLSRRGAIALPGCRLFEEWVSRERDREREREIGKQ